MPPPLRFRHAPGLGRLADLHTLNFQALIATKGTGIGPIGNGEPAIGSGPHYAHGMDGVVVATRTQRRGTR